MNSIVSEKRYISERLGVPYENLSQSYLRAETPLDGQTLSSIDFTLQTNKKQGSFVTERLLDLNDEFVITHFTVGVNTADSSSTDVEHLTSKIQTYASEGVFGSGYAVLEGVYNGSLSFTIDRTEFIPEYPCRAFKRVPVTQNQNPADFIQNGYDNGLYGFAVSEPTKIDGRQTLDLSIDLGTALNFAAVSSANASIVFEARGYLIVNAK